MLLLQAEADVTILSFYVDTRSIPEPAGALAVAGMKRYVIEHGLQDSGKRFVATVSGANMNFSRLRFVSERSELGQKREVLLMVQIPEKPGSFLRLAQKIFPRAVSEFSYRYNSSERAQIFLSFLLDTPATGTSAPAGTVGPSAGGMPVPPAAMPVTTSALTNGSESESTSRVPSPSSSQLFDHSAAHVDLATATHKSEVQSIISSISDEGMDAVDISDNEVAKAHARYMVGGRSKVPNERLFQFSALLA